MKAVIRVFTIFVYLLVPATSGATVIDYAKLLSCNWQYGGKESADPEAFLRGLNPNRGVSLMGLNWKQEVRTLILDAHPELPVSTGVDYTDVLLRLNAEIAGLCPIPPAIDIVVEFTSVFGAVTNRYVYVENEFHPDYVGSLVPRDVKAAFGHEYGHTVFFEMLFEAARTRPSLRGLREAMERQAAVNKLSLLEWEMIDLRDSSKRSVPPKAELVSAANALVSVFREARKALTKQPLSAEALAANELEKTLLLPFNEMWADLFALLYDGKPDCLVVAGNSALRRFDNAFDPATWSDGRVHTFFSPAKGWLWHNHLESATMAERARMLPAVFESMLSVVDVLLVLRQRGLSVPGPEVQNVLLIEALKRRLPPR